jgi:hypothetical protein
MILRTLQKIIQHKTIPAPEVLQDDPWFGPAPETEKSISIKEAKAKAIADAQLLPCESDNHHPLHQEPEDIHQKMYEIATSSGNTTTQLDPMPEFGGGSESYHSGPGGWMSGTGARQFH